MIRGRDSANMAGNRYFAVSTRGTATAVVKGNVAAGDPENCSTVLLGRFGPPIALLEPKVSLFTHA